MVSNAFPVLFYFLLATWGLINLLQGIFTELNYDEAYYWMFSKHLDWGYFDQPPMIAWFIRIGTLFLSHEIGVRIITVFAQLIVLILLWKMTGEKQPTPNKILLFFGIAGSVVMFVTYGFIATPDSPLLMFIALFLYSYQKFLKKESLGHTILLALAMTGMAYSKYHSILFVLFIVLSNLSLFRSKWFWMAAGLTLVLILPHLFWQYQNDFPSFTYQLVSRLRPFEWKYVLDYWPNQFFSFNPLFLGLSLYLIWRFRPLDTFEKGIYYVLAGFLLFFFVSALRGNVEPHWTISAAPGMIIIVYRRSINYTSIRKYVYRFLFPTIAIILLLRVALVIPFLPVNMKFHGEKAWAQKMQSIAGGRPVLFHNSYQKPSIYTFYTGQEASSLSSIDYRKTQYDLWNWDTSFYGKPVLLVTQNNDPYSTRYIFPNGKKVYLHPADDFFAVNQLKVEIPQAFPGLMHVGDTISFQGSLFNPYTYPLPFDHPAFRVEFELLFLKNGNEMVLAPLSMSPSIPGLQPKESRSLAFTFQVPDVCTGKYLIGVVMKQGVIQETMISKGQKVMVVEKGYDQ